MSLVVAAAALDVDCSAPSSDPLTAPAVDVQFEFAHRSPPSPSTATTPPAPMPPRRSGVRCRRGGPGLPKDSARLIELAAPLHDLGKVAIADAILLKNGPLTAGERRVDATAHDHRRADARGQRDARPPGGAGDRAEPSRALGRRRLSARARAGRASRCPAGSSRSPTSSTRSRQTARTSAPGRSPRRSTRSAACAARTSTRRSPTPSCGSTTARCSASPDGL